MNRDLLNIVSFFVGVMLAAFLLFPYAAHASVVVTPQISGYSRAAGMFASPAGSFSMTAANDGFVKPAVLNIGAKAVTIPAALRMASNAGQYAKSAMRLNPWAIAGTLAAAWLLDHGMEYSEGVWLSTVTNPYGGLDYETCTSGQVGGTHTESYVRQAILANPQNHYYGCSGWHDCTTANGGVYCQAWGAPGQTGFSGCAAYQCTGQPNPQQRPATDDDWDALPDPLPAIAPEVPYAPYLPEGIPVNDPEYEPTVVPLGVPYVKPDGWTVQPKAKLSPAGDGQVRVDTYDEPLFDPAGQPVQNPDPTDTPEQPPDPCDEHPERAGCVDLGTPEPTEPLETLEIPVSPNVTPVGGAGSCPADVTTSAFGITFSYQPFCDFATAIRPLIIGFAWLSFAFIVAGTVRT